MQTTVGSLFLIYFKRNQLTELTFYKSMEALYGSETWVRSQRKRGKVTSAEMKVLRLVMLQDKISNAQMRQALKIFKYTAELRNTTPTCVSIWKERRKIAFPNLP